MPTTKRKPLSAAMIVMRAGRKANAMRKRAEELRSKGESFAYDWIVSEIHYWDGVRQCAQYWKDGTGLTDLT